MITVRCVLKDESLYDIVDEVYKECEMERIDQGVYQGDKPQTFSYSIFAMNSLMKKDWFLDNVISYEEDYGEGDVEDILKEYEIMRESGLV